MILRFFTQPCAAYRNFQIAYTILTLNFLIPAVSYLVAPHIAVDQVHQISALLGDVPYEVSEDSHMWRFLAFSDVMALAFMCLLLQLNLRRWYPVLLPLMFLKGCSVFASAYVGLVQYHHPFFAFPVVLDAVTVVVMGVFASRAHRQLALIGDAELIPRPRFAVWEGRPLLWTAMERRWMHEIVGSLVPLDDPDRHREALEQGLERLRRGMPALQRLALRFAVWLVVVIGGPSIGRWRPFVRLEAHERDAALVALGSSDRFVVREMVVLLKLAAGFGLELDPSILDELGWGGGDPVQVEGVG